MKTRVLPHDKAVEALADDFISFVKANPCGTAVIEGSKDTEKVFEFVVEKLRDEAVFLSKIRIFELCAFDDRTNSAYDRITGLLTENSDFNSHYAVRLTAETLLNYGDMISQYGGAGYILLDLGENARIGFNEPGAQYSSVSRLQKLSPKTIESLKSDYPAVPESAYTMGISEIISAKHIAVAAFGERKAEALYKMLYARTDSVVPAAFLQLPFDVLTVADEDAAVKL